jgi:Delta7-sterol 5-desaturase
MSDTRPPNVVASARTPLWVALVGAIVGIAATVVNPGTPTQRSEALTDLAQTTIQYLSITTVFFSLFWVLLGDRLVRRRISRKRWPKRAQVAREVTFSIAAMLVFLGVNIWIVFLNPWSSANMYTSVSDYGWFYYAFVLFLTFVLHDTYFYWAHRLMHHPKLYARFHRVHHESTDPTPFTAYSFHPLEAMMEGLAAAALIPLFVVLPWHASILFVWGLGQIVLNVIGHLGYEVYPSWWHRVPLLNQKTTATHHYMHHQMVGGNYGLYFRWWDRACGTEFKNYERKFDALFKKPAPVSSGAKRPVAMRVE